MPQDLPPFDTPDLARVIEALPPVMLDQLPYGCIRIDKQQMVALYSEAERRLSGSGSRQRLNLHFFTEVAPCMDDPAFRGRIAQALEQGHVDLEFGWVGDFNDAERSLRVRVQSASGGGCWIFLLREQR